MNYTCVRITVFFMAFRDLRYNNF